MTLNQMIYKASRPLGGLRIARYMARKHPRILMYHRLSQRNEPETLTKELFREQMLMVRRSFNPMTLSQLLKHREAGSVPEHAVVITFDDGYSDFAEMAYPILKELRIPATLFITTGFVNGDLWLWPDQLRYAIDHRKGTSAFQLDESEAPIDIDVDPDRAWNSIADYCLTLSNQQKMRLIDSLFSDLNVVKPAQAPSKYSALSWQELKAMVDEGLDIGSHTVSHPILTKLNTEELEYELRESKETIFRKLGVSTEVFCYPNGSQNDFNEAVKNLISKAGYKYAVAAFPDSKPIADRWCIHRYPAQYKLAEFEKNLFGLSQIYMRVFG